jgi:hypothetical protein
VKGATQLDFGDEAEQPKPGPRNAKYAKVLELASRSGGATWVQFQAAGLHNLTIADALTGLELAGELRTTERGAETWYEAVVKEEMRGE